MAAGKYVWSCHEYIMSLTREVMRVSRATRHLLVMVMLVVVALNSAQAMPALDDTWPGHQNTQQAYQQDLDDVKGLYPLLVLQLPNRHDQIPLLAIAPQKRNAELVNTLLGSQGLRNMHIAGRR
ncbi:hypothetical protein Pmani_011305 [Petrolisthes manimaculis]|uniref:Uncharacterized protein n=1 Tax=Petrolisthes manimaculis TaxID=1843537 RepID=A0AAE1PZQ2_9EUCA|nr:hypothetical protein Pmani_011305 [Petrolisthes manimaculis]